MLSNCFQQLYRSGFVNFISWLSIELADCKAESLHQTVIYQTDNILIDNLK